MSWIKIEAVNFLFLIYSMTYVLVICFPLTGRIFEIRLYILLLWDMYVSLYVVFAYIILRPCYRIEVGQVSLGSDVNK